MASADFGYQFSLINFSRSRDDVQKNRVLVQVDVDVTCGGVTGLCFLCKRFWEAVAGELALGLTKGC